MVFVLAKTLIFSVSSLYTKPAGYSIMLPPMFSTNLVSPLEVKDIIRRSILPLDIPFALTWPKAQMVPSGMMLRLLPISSKEGVPMYLTQ